MNSDRSEKKRTKKNDKEKDLCLYSEHFSFELFDTTLILTRFFPSRLLGSFSSNYSNGSQETLFGQ